MQKQDISQIYRRVLIRGLRDYAAGVPPKKIAMALESEGIPYPSGGACDFSTINSNRKRGNGVSVS
jgi:hypothetical protein